MRRLLLVLSFAAAWGPGLAAGDFYRYETEAGTVSYAGEADAIPARYRASAERVSGQALRSYARLTPAEPARAPLPARLDLGAGAVLELPVARGTIGVSRKGFWKDGVYRTALVLEQQGEILAMIEQDGSISVSDELSLD